MFPCCVCSSLYYDEDGDLAHEFYEETVVTKNGRKKSKLKRIQKNLIPQVSLGQKWWQCSRGLCQNCRSSSTMEIVCLCLSGNHKARPPLHSCRFPHRPLWGVKRCTGLICSEAATGTHFRAVACSSEWPRLKLVWREGWKFIQILIELIY